MRIETVFTKWINIFFTILLLLSKLGTAQDTIETTNSTEIEEFIGISNITATAIYDKEDQVIKLQVSWKNSAESKYIIKSSLVEEEEYCKTDFKNEHAVSSTTNIILSGNHYSGCSYNVVVVEQLADDQNATFVVFRVPDCVNTKCKCLYQIHPEPIIAPKQISSDVIRLFWRLPGIMNMTNVTQIEFRIFQPGNQPKVLVRNITTECMTQQCHDDIDVPGMTPGVLYHMHAWYSNSQECKSSRWRLTYHAQAVKESQMVFQVMISMMFVSMFLVAMCLVWKRYRRCSCLSGHNQHLKRIDRPAVNGSRKRSNLLVPMEYNNLYIDKDIAEEQERGTVDKYEMSYKQLQFGPQIGDGAFGQVFKARVLNIARLAPHSYVAVKTLKKSATNEELEEFLLEIAMLKQIGHHPNIVMMLGCCTLRKPYCIVMEYIPCGDLLRYLRALRTYYERNAKDFTFNNNGKETLLQNSYNKTPNINMPLKRLSSDSEMQYTMLGSPDALECVLDPRELQSFAVQVACGMRHLESKQIVHRDLAARNVLIDYKKTLKISDFGLSRKGIYVNSKQRKVPLRWLSVEAICDNLYTSKSDVWAYGIVLWEIGTLGAFPYYNVSNGEFLEFLLSGERLEKPENFTDELYALMQRCWSQSADDRPSFAELLEDLEAISNKRHVYVDFSQLNPAYMFPPTTQI